VWERVAHVLVRALHEVFFHLLVSLFLIVGAVCMACLGEKDGKNRPCARLSHRAGGPINANNDAMNTKIAQTP
jgi:hypothetical protein